MEGILPGNLEGTRKKGNRPFLICAHVQDERPGGQAVGGTLRDQTASFRKNGGATIQRAGRDEHVEERRQDKACGSLHKEYGSFAGEHR